MKRILLVVVFFVFATPAAHGAEYENSAGEISLFKSWLGQKTATGDWQGLRSQLEDDGITISSSFTTDIGGNPVGGLKKRMIYSGFLDVGLAFDFEKIASLDGLALTIGNYLASGNDLSNAVGNSFSVQEIYTPGNYFFGELDFSLSLLDDTLILEAGRLFAGDTFARSRIWEYYVSGGINDNLNSISENIFFSTFTTAAWAVRTTYQPRKEWYAIAAMYNADARIEKPKNYGTYFNFAMDSGYLAMGQLTYKHNQSRKDDGLPGSASFGCYYQSSRFQDLAIPSKRWHGNYGFYIMADQMIYKGYWPPYKGPRYLRAGSSRTERVKHPYDWQMVAAADRPEGLTAWAAAYLAPQEHTNTQTYQLAGGLLCQGLPHNRDYDVTAFCVILGNFSNQLEGQKMETVLELNHRFQVGPWLYITPDVQFVINPNGRRDIRNALVLDLELSFDF